MEAEEPAVDNLEQVRTHYEAFARDELDSLIEGLDPEVEITVHDEHGKPSGDPVSGHDGARAFFTEIGSTVSGRTVEIQRLRADEDRVLAWVRLGGTLKSTGESGTIDAIHLFTIYDGLIREIKTHRPNWRG
jgi:ketosteroid isomerase-like protein